MIVLLDDKISNQESGINPGQVHADIVAKASLMFVSVDSAEVLGFAAITRLACSPAPVSNANMHELCRASLGRRGADQKSFQMDKLMTDAGLLNDDLSHDRMHDYSDAQQLGEMAKTQGALNSARKSAMKKPDYHPAHFNRAFKAITESDNRRLDLDYFVK
jgi:hypothetical protein